MPGW
jgi:hypothetical protein